MLDRYQALFSVCYELCGEYLRVIVGVEASSIWLFFLVFSCFRVFLVSSNCGLLFFIVFWFGFWLRLEGVFPCSIL